MIIHSFNSSPPGHIGRYFTDDVFKCIFLNKKNVWIEIKICSCGSNWQTVRIGSGNGLESIRRQAIIWTNADIIHWRINAALGEMS